MGKNQEKGEALRKRVAALFSKTLPFNFNVYKENMYYLTPVKNLFSKIDVTIEDDKETYLVIECKNVSKKPTLQDIADRVKRLKGDKKAKSGLIVISGAKITKEDIEEIKNKYQIFLWNDELLSYYESLATVLKEFSFFEIMKSLEIELESHSGDTFRPAVEMRQDVGGELSEKMEIISFTAFPEDMIKRSFVFRHANKQGGSYQRLLRQDKLNKIADYVKNGGNITNSITLLLPNECHFMPVKLDKSEERAWYYAKDVKGTLGKLTLPDKFCFIEIIDGQHRLFSFTRCDEVYRKTFPLNFIGIKGGDIGLARDIFITINQKARKIEANLLATILEEWDKKHLDKSESLAREIVRELNRNKKSSLRGKILESEKLTTEQKSLKLYIAMLSSHGIKRLVSEKGYLKKIIQKNDVKPYYEEINKYIQRVKKIFPKNLHDTTKFVVFTNNGMIPLLRLFDDLCKYCQKLPTVNNIDKMLKVIESYNWSLEYIRGRTSGAGWKRTYEELVKLVRDSKQFKNF